TPGRRMRCPGLTTRGANDTRIKVPDGGQVMPRLNRAAVPWLVLVACLGCGPANANGPGAVSAPPKPAVPKHVNAAMMGEPTSLVARFNSTQISLPGAGTLEQFVNGTLLEIDGEGKLQPQLAEAVPTIQNGLWKLF